MIKNIAAALASLLLATTSAHALQYGTATVGQVIPTSPATFSLFTGGMGETGSQKNWIAQAIELPYGLHGITLNSISIAIFPGTRPYLYTLGEHYYEAIHIGQDWVKFDLGGAAISSTRFVVKIFGENYRCCEAGPDFRLANMLPPAGFDGSHLIRETYGEFGTAYTHIWSDRVIAFSLDYDASSTPVPEASTTAMLALGLIGLGLIVRGSRRRIEREH